VGFGLSERRASEQAGLLQGVLFFGRRFGDFGEQSPCALLAGFLPQQRPQQRARACHIAAFDGASGLAQQQVYIGSAESSLLAAWPG
jgi:hypothetical protein